MKRLLSIAVIGAILLGASAAYADADKGQKYYLKLLKPKTGYNGTKFAAQHTQEEWSELFANGGEGFIKEFSAKHPELENYLNSEQFKEKVMEHIKDFAIKYANDSGNVPSC